MSFAGEIKFVVSYLRASRMSFYGSRLEYPLDENLVKYCKEDFAKEFEMKELGLMHYFVGMEVWKGDEELFVSEGKYANETLKKF